MSTEASPTLRLDSDMPSEEAVRAAMSEQMLAEAVVFHSEGKLEDAESIYRIVLGSDPENADALHLLGVLANDVGRAEVAIELIGKSIEIRPDFGEAHHNLGVALYRLDDWPGAAESYRKALEFEPENAATLRGLASALTGQGSHEEAVAVCRHAIEIDPNHPQAHNNLANALKHLGEIEEAEVACRRALELQPNHLMAMSQLQELEALLASMPCADTDAEPLRLDPDMEFRRLVNHADSNVLTGVSADTRHFIKIEFVDHPGKQATLEEETEFMRHLTDAECQSCPAVLASGILRRDDLLPCLAEAERAAVEAAGRDRFPYLVQAYIKNDGTWTIADMILSYLEQKALGVYQGDPKPDNLRSDPDTGICHIVDYDQAERLDPVMTAAGNLEFLDWCDARARAKYGFESWLAQFPDITVERDVAPLFRNGAFDIGETTIWQRQETTLSSGGIYHRLDTDRLFTNGERDLGARKNVLDRIEFQPGERILDIGCNAGLLSMYLEDRGCDVHGVDLDASIILGARFTHNVLGRKARFDCLDLDGNELPGSYDTVMLFSVIHHTRNLEANARKIAENCRRIVIECRLVEAGAKPEDSGWTETSHWSYDSVDALIAGLEALFPGFALHENHGQVDRDRYILELRKD